MAEPNEGYIRLHRRLWEHPYWQDPERLRAWVDCLLMAAWKPHRRLVGTSQVDIPRGAFVASERFLADRWGWSRGKIRRFLAAAQEADELRPINDTSGGTTYLVVKYDDYQRGRPTDETGNGTDPGPPSDQERTTSGPPSDQIEGRERREEEGKEVGGGGEQPPPTDWKTELRTASTDLVERWCDTDRDRRSFEAATEMLVEGFAWRNPHDGERIPEAERPALYRTAALRHFEKPAYSLDQSLGYVLKRELDPGNDPEARKESKTAGDRRLQEQRSREAEERADQLRIQRWKNEHPDRLAELQSEAEKHVDLPPGDIGRSMLLKAKLSQLIQRELGEVQRAG